MKYSKVVIRSGLIRIVGMMVAFLTTVFLSRVLGPTDFGVYTFAFTIVMLSSLLIHGGLSTLIVRSASNYIQSGSWGLLEGLYKWSNSIVFIISLALVTSLIAIFYYIDIVNKDINTHLASLLLIPLISFTAVRTSLLRGFDNAVVAQLPEQIIRPVIWLVLLLFTSEMMDLSPTSVMYFHCLSFSIAFIVGHILYKNRTPTSVVSTVDYKKEVWLKEMLPFTVIAGVQVLNSQLDVLMIGFMLDASGVGRYQVVLQIVKLVSFPLVLINFILAPKIAKWFSSGDKEEIRFFLKKITKLVVSLSFIISVFFIIFGEFFIVNIFGKEYVSSYSALIILVLGQLVNSFIGPVGLLLTMSGHEKSVATGMFLSLLINGILNLNLIPYYGINGAAASTAATLAFWNIYMAKELWKKEGILIGILNFTSMKK